MFTTYILENPFGKLYIGYTSDINIRLIWHNEGRSKFTRNKGPWILKYRKDFATKTEAIKYERELKSIKNNNYLKRKLSL